MRDRNFVAGNLLMFFVGVIMFATLALLPTMLQQSMDYPVATAGLVTAPRGIGTMIAMFLVGRIINLVDIRLLILSGLALTTLSLYQMSGFSLAMDMQPIIVSGLVQGFGLGFVFVPLSTISFATLPRSVLTQGTAIFSLTRNIGSSIGIAILEALFVENTQIVHSRLVEQLRPDNPLAQATLPVVAVQPELHYRHCSTQCRGHAAGADGRLYRRLQIDDVHRLSRGAPTVAAAQAARGERSQPRSRRVSGRCPAQMRIARDTSGTFFEATLQSALQGEARCLPTDWIRYDKVPTNAFRLTNGRSCIALPMTCAHREFWTA